MLAYYASRINVKKKDAIEKANSAFYRLSRLNQEVVQCPI
jgi:hypothetical protein